MDLGSRRQKVPLWPPGRHGAYQNLNSAEELPLQNSPSLSTPGTSMSTAYKSLLTPRFTPSPLHTPGLYSAQTTPHVGASPDELRYDSESPRKRWLGHGWRGGARIALIGCVVALIINVVLILYMTLSYEHMGGFPVIYRGTCEKAEDLNRVWHFLLNFLSTGLLAASNYCMQLLSAPTRANIDQAHARGRWLDIGIPSIRNLRFLHWKRRALWLALCISSIPLHLVYNSTFYAAIATNDYNVLYATDDFANGGNYDIAKFPDSAAQNISSFHHSASTWKELSNQDCIREYAHDFITKYRNVILVTNSTSESNDALLQVAINELPKNGYIDPMYDSFAWICNDTQTANKTGVTDRNNAGFVPCSSQSRSLESMADTWWRSGGYHITHCLAEEIKPDCHLHFSPHLMGPVILMNIVKCLVAFYVAFRMLDKPLVTLGDAIETFVKHPDPTTAGMCLTTGHEAARMFHRHASYTGPREPQIFHIKRQRWYNVVTRRQWMLLAALVVAMIFSLVAGIIFGTEALAPPTIANAWSVGLGQVQTQNLVLTASLPQLGASAVLITALLANAPQAVLSFLYMIYNTIFTTLYIGEDWDLFGAYTTKTRHSIPMASRKQTHRYLRVSDPKGKQKSTHFLNLPFRYAIPLICVSGLLHWLMSQSLYLANISVIPRDGTLPHHDEITTVAFAPQGMIWLTVMAVIMSIIVVANACRRFGGQMQIVGSNSAAISAACHVGHMPERRRREMVLRKVAWGEVPSTDAGLSKRQTMSSESEYGLGLGIASPGKSRTAQNMVYSANDLLDTVDRDGDGAQNEYQVLRGRVELMDGNESAHDTAVAHCAFSDGFVFRPEEGKLYA